MDSIISSLQSIPKPSFLQNSNRPQSSRSSQNNPPQNTSEQNVSVPLPHPQPQSTPRSQQPQPPNMNIPMNPFQTLSNITSKAHEQSQNRNDDTNDNDLAQIDLPSLSFTDFGVWDLQPYNHLFMRERLRFRIESNAKEYAKHGIVAQSVPLKL